MREYHTPVIFVNTKQQQWEIYGSTHQECIRYQFKFKQHRNVFWEMPGIFPEYSWNIAFKTKSPAVSVASCPNAEIIYCNIIFKRCKFIHWVWVWLIERVYIWQVRVWDSHLCWGPALGGRWHKSNIGFGWSGNIASCLGHKQKLNRLFDHREKMSPALDVQIDNQKLSSTNCTWYWTKGFK